MPKPGFKSITVSENVYKKFFRVYEKNKKGLEIKGIRSFSGYLTNMMEEMMVRYEAFVKHAPYMEKLSIDQNRVVLKDNKRNRIAEVLLKEGELQCLLDERPDCVHVGFVYSLPELYNNEIKVPPRSAYGEILAQKFVEGWHYECQTAYKGCRIFFASSENQVFPGRSKTTF